MERSIESPYREAGARNACRNPTGIQGFGPDFFAAPTLVKPVDSGRIQIYEIGSRGIDLVSLIPSFQTGVASGLTAVVGWNRWRDQNGVSLFIPTNLIVVSTSSGSVSGKDPHGFGTSSVFGGSLLLFLDGTRGSSAEVTVTDKASISFSVSGYDFITVESRSSSVPDAVKPHITIL